MSKITVVEQASVSTPSAGQASIYVDSTTKKLASKDDAGAVTDYGAPTSEFSDASFRIQDDGDATKELAFQVSGITTSTTRTITVPDADITLDDAGDPRTDPDAIHDNVAGEIAAVALKATPVAADVVLIEDSADSNNKKRATLSSLPASSVFTDDLFRIQDDGDNTKQIAFQASGITTATTRTITVPDANITIGGITSSAPANVTKAAAAVGTSAEVARADHKHDVTTAAPSGTAVQIGNSAAEGSATSLARSDHTHTVTGGTPVNVTKAANSAGVATTFARSDHKHDVTTAAPSGTAVQVGNSASEGAATSLARSDHTHTVTAGTPATIGTANATGSATTFVRSDHVHAHGNQTSGTLHAAATTSVNGFMSAADKTKLDAVSIWRRRYAAYDLLSPTTANWTVNAFAPLSADTANSGLPVRRFDDTTQEGVGFGFTIPTGSTNLIITFKSRAQSTPGGTVGVQPVLYTRTVGDNSAVGSWSAGTQLTPLSFPTNTNFQYDSQTITLSTLSLTAGNYVQFELTRLGTDGDDTLSGDWTLLELGVEFT